MNKKIKLNVQSGQAFTEYLILTSVIVSSYLIVTQGLSKFGIQQKIFNYLTETFTATYQFGHWKTKGFESGAPTYHPRVDDGGKNNFRIFINPVSK